MSCIILLLEFIFPSIIWGVEERQEQVGVELVWFPTDMKEGFVLPDKGRMRRNVEVKSEVGISGGVEVEVEWRGRGDEGQGTHPLLKGKYTGHEITYLGDHNISPRLAETKRNQKKLGKSDLPIFLGGSRFPSG